MNFAVKFDSNSPFTVEALSRLEQIGFIILTELETCQGPFKSVTGMEKADLPINTDSFSLLETWVKQQCPTWMNFFWVLREIKLNHLADQIEAALGVVTVEQVTTSNLDINEETSGNEKENKLHEQGEDK